MSLELLVLGSSGSGPSRAGPASGYLVTAGDRTIWMDAGTGTFLPLASATDPAGLDAVVISHGHADHCADLLGLVYHLAYRVGAERAIPTFAAPGVVDRLRGFLGTDGGHPLPRVLAIDEVGDGDRRTVGDVELAFATTVHPVPTVGVRIAHDDRVLAYSGDTGPGGGFPALAAGADTVLCEAGMVGPRREGAFPFHLDPGEAGGVATRAGAGRLVVTHLAPSLTVREALDAATRSFDGPVDIAEPGLRVRV